MMKLKSKVTVILSWLIFMGSAGAHNSSQLPYRVQSVNDVVALFPKTPQEMRDFCNLTIAQARKDLDTLIAIPDKDRSCCA